ncbi:hypothetical protein [Parapedobacter pyrenivorans]|uniref:hypothetical protein n=1 Tax=Parapedobacter pyrenivorans TaxID=1305674 RepID=UPI0033406389
MKTFILAVVCAFSISCIHTPPRGDDPVRRDSIGDPIHPADTAVERRDPDSLRDTSKPEF